VAFLLSLSVVLGFGLWLLLPSANQQGPTILSGNIVTPTTTVVSAPSSTPAALSSPTFTPSPTMAPIPSATPTRASTPTAVPRTPTPAKTESAATLLQQVDEPWGKGDWLRVIVLLTQARTLEPTNQIVADKLYVAYYNYGQTLFEQGKKTEAAQQFQNALVIKADGAEAKQALLNLTPAPTRPPCPAVTGVFANVWGLVQGNIGCATSGVIASFMAEENFERGKMFWLESLDANSVLALHNDNRTWQQFKSEQWIEGRLEFSCANANTPAQCPPTPKRGFGRAWCDLSNGLRNSIGNATDCERGYNATMQRFERGFIVQTDRSTLYVFYTNGRWETR
jgi:hypothetical protein